MELFLSIQKDIWAFSEKKFALLAKSRVSCIGHELGRDIGTWNNIHVWVSSCPSASFFGFLLSVVWVCSMWVQLILCNEPLIVCICYTTPVSSILDIDHSFDLTWNCLWSFTSIVFLRTVQRYLSFKTKLFEI